MQRACQDGRADHRIGPLGGAGCGHRFLIRMRMSLRQEELSGADFGAIARSVGLHRPKETDAALVDGIGGVRLSAAQQDGDADLARFGHGVIDLATGFRRGRSAPIAIEGIDEIERSRFGRTGSAASPIRE
jgi:hypothetical protein